MIQIKDLNKTYGEGTNAVHALRNCNVEFEYGKFTAIIGTSGSGKSTLLHLMGGLDTKAEGEIFYDDEDILRYSDAQLAKFRRKNIGFVFQFFNLVPELTAKENIFLPQLSGGQQQRVAIARALIHKPKVLLCDEPTGNLDSQSGKEVLRLLRELQSEDGQTIIMVTHDGNIADQADRIVRIEDGQIKCV